MDFPDLVDFKITPHQKQIIDKIQVKVEEAAYDLLKTVNQKYVSSGVELQIATSESLTAGLIMSSLVNIPIAGRFKYGCLHGDRRRRFSKSMRCMVKSTAQ